MPKRVAIGVVTSDKTAKTRRVEIPRQVRHPKYGKILHRKTVCHVHDEKNESQAGRHGRDRRVPSQVAHQALGAGASRGAEASAVDLAAMRAAAKALWKRMPVRGVSPQVSRLVFRPLVPRERVSCESGVTMIQMQTRLNVADNTGAKEVMCFKVLGGSKKRTAGLGDIIVCSVKTRDPRQRHQEEGDRQVRDRALPENRRAAPTAATSASTATPSC